MHADNLSPPIEAAEGVPKRRKQADRTSLAKGKLLQAARELVSEGGLQNLTLAEVGRRAGFSRGNPARHFESKQGLIDALIEDLFHAPGEMPPGLESIIHFAGRPYAADLTAQRCRLMIWGAALSDPSIGDRLKALDCANLSWLERHLVAAINARAISADVDPKHQALLIIAGARAGLYQWLLNPQGSDVSALRDEALASLQGALGTAV